MVETVYIQPPNYPESYRNVNTMQRATFNTGDWCAAATTKTITPPEGKQYLLPRIGIAAYNPATDFGATITAKKLSADDPATFINATGYAPLITSSDRIDTFKIGAADMLSIHWRFRNSIILNYGESFELAVSELITGTDKFYVGVSVIEF